MNTEPVTSNVTAFRRITRKSIDLRSHQSFAPWVGQHCALGSTKSWEQHGFGISGTHCRDKPRDGPWCYTQPTLCCACINTGFILVGFILIRRTKRAYSWSRMSNLIQFPHTPTMLWQRFPPESLLLNQHPHQTMMRPDYPTHDFDTYRIYFHPSNRIISEGSLPVLS